MFWLATYLVGAASMFKFSMYFFPFAERISSRNTKYDAKDSRRFSGGLILWYCCLIATFWVAVLPFFLIGIAVDYFQGVNPLEESEFHRWLVARRKQVKKEIEETKQMHRLNMTPEEYKVYYSEHPARYRETVRSGLK